MTTTDHENSALADYLKYDDRQTLAVLADHMDEDRSDPS